MSLALTPADIAGLPDELLEQLSITASDRFDFLILNLMEEAGGRLSLDHILIGIYQQTGKVYKRATINARLYRMERRGLVASTQNKGVYTLPITACTPLSAPLTKESA